MHSVFLAGKGVIDMVITLNVQVVNEIRAGDLQLKKQCLEATVVEWLESKQC